jgi:hypothetical protein
LVRSTEGSISIAIDPLTRGRPADELIYHLTNAEARERFDIAQSDGEYSPSLGVLRGYFTERSE